MIQFLILTAELTLLCFLSRWLTQTLYTFFLLIFNIRSIAISLVTLLLFPGTVIHELSHLFVAEILGVRTGKLTLAPEEIRETNVKAGPPASAWKRSDWRAGSVAIAATDPIRRALIGIAPVFAGIISLAGFSYFLHTKIFHWSDWRDWSNWSNLFFYYLLFAISNSMFSSKQDLKGFWPVALAVSLIIAAGFVAGLRFGLAGQAAIIAQQIIMSLTRSLAQVLAVNGVLLLTLSVLIALLRKSHL